MDNKINVTIFNRTFIFETDPALFSPKKLDDGTRLLLEKTIIPKSAKTILDFGCGWGAIGIIVAKTHPDLQVVMVDNDPLALKISKNNLALNQVNNVRLLPSHALSFSPQFSLILTNPPWHKNKSVIPQMIEQAYSLLEPGGQLYIIISRQYKTEELLKRRFANAKIIATSTSYKVLVSKG